MQILEYCFNNYSQINIKEKVEEAFIDWSKDNRIEIIKGKEQCIKPKLEETEYTNFPVKNGEEEKIEIQIECKEALEAPVQEGMQVGTLKVMLGKEKIIERSLNVSYTINKKEPIDYWCEIWDLIKSFKFLNALDVQS